MGLFILLLLAVIAIVVFVAIALAVGGLTAIVFFGDALICVALILVILRGLFRRK